MNRYRCTVTVRGNVDISSDFMLSELDVRNLLLKRGFNVVGLNADISNFHPEGLIEVEKVEKVEIKNPEPPKQSMITVAGKHFRCECGGNDI